MIEVECPYCYVSNEIDENDEYCLCGWCDKEFQVEKEN